MIYLASGVTLNRELAERIFRQFAADPSQVRGSIRIESSEETLSHQECNILVQNLRAGSRVGSQFFHEFYSQSDPRALLFIDSENEEMAREIAAYIDEALGCELRFESYPDARAAGL